MFGAKTPIGMPAGCDHRRHATVPVAAHASGRPRARLIVAKDGLEQHV